MIFSDIGMVLEERLCGRAPELRESTLPICFSAIIREL